MPEHVKHNRSIDAQTIKDFWVAFMNDKKLFVISLARPISVLASTIGLPYFIGKILAGLSDPNFNTVQYVSVLITVALVGFFGNLYGFGKYMLLMAKAMRILQENVFAHLLKRSVGFHNNKVSGKLVSDALDYPTAFSQIMNNFYLGSIGFFVTIVIGLTIIWINSILLGMLLTLMTIFAISSAFYSSRKRAQGRIDRHNASKLLTAHMADTIVNLPTVKTFAHEKVELARHRELSEKLLELRMRDWIKVGHDGSYRIGVLMAFQIAFVIITSIIVHRNAALLATGIFAFSYTLNVTYRLFDITEMIRSIEDGLLMAMPMTEVLHQEPEINDIKGAKDIVVQNGNITFEHVTFKYNDATSDDTIFYDFNMAITPGERIGLVGPSGGGKSTFTRLMLRFEDIQDGSITIDDQNIANVKQTSLRRAISYVPQEPLLFHRSVKENIAYGLSDDVTPAAITKAAILAHADEFITKLPNGYDTIVGERGIKLSGGQRQRVAIARAILKNAPLLVLDEATSSLDSESESLIQSALWNLMKDKTCVVIAHRLSTIQKMDRIVVLDNGKIVESGPHKHLLKQNGLYARLWAHQSGGFLED